MTQEQLEIERGKFEAWADGRIRLGLNKYPNGMYYTELTQMAWNVWQTAISSREWVSLTNTEITRIYEVPELAGTQFDNGTEKAIAITRAMELRIKEKNT